MFDIFLMEDVRKLMKMKSIVFLGDSNVRALYKDFLCLLHESRFIPPSILKNKMESAVYGDRLVYHGRKTNGRCYREEREASFNGTRASFFFLTKVYDGYVEDVLDRITRRSKPDVIIINSCVWDITRWGCNGVYDYKENLKYLMKEFRRCLPDCLVIWITTPPLAAEMKGGFLVNELQFLKYSLRFHVVEANHYARKVVVDNGFDILDTHFHLQMQIHRRSKDGIHWDPKPIRYVTNLILRHISLSWNVPLPHRYESSVVDENLVASEDSKSSRIIKLGTKKTAVDVRQGHYKEPGVSECSEKLRSKVIVVDNKEDTKKKRRGSLQLYRVPRKEESIHKHMAKAEIMARHARIRKWKQTVLGDSPVSSTPNFGRNLRAKNKTRNKRDKRRKANLSNKSFQPNQQPHNNYMQSDEFQALSFNVSNNNNDFPLITSPSQIPLPPYSPDSSSIQKSKFELQSFDASFNVDFPIITSPSQIPCPSYENFDNNPPQRHVVDCETTRFSSSGFTRNGNKVSSHSQSAFLNRQFQHGNRIFETVSNSVKPYEFPHVTPGQTLWPRINFANDEIPEDYLF